MPIKFYQILEGFSLFLHQKSESVDNTFSLFLFFQILPKLKFLFL